jgi:two-component system response regulator LytT
VCKIFIVEDELYVRDEIKFILKKHASLEVVGEADNSLDAVLGIQNTNPNVVFLDIKLGDLDGITLAKKIIEMNKDIKIVFVTAFDHYAVEGFELNAVDYVLKPFSEERLAKTVKRIIHDEPTESKSAIPSKANDKLIMKDNKVWKIVDIKDICYFQCQDHVTTAVTVSGSYTLGYTLRDLEAQLPENTFIRIHKSFILNIGFIHEIIPWFNYTYKITIKNGCGELPVGRSYMKKFKSALMLS